MVQGEALRKMDVGARFAYSRSAAGNFAGGSERAENLGGQYSSVRIFRTGRNLTNQCRSNSNAGASSKVAQISPCENPRECVVPRVGFAQGLCFFLCFARTADPSLRSR